MLLSLAIRNFILIDTLDLDFNSGLMAVTGETGSGKSIILDAILFGFGYKSFSNPVRAEQEFCSVTIVASISEEIRQILDENNVEYADEIIIKKIQTNSGRKKFLVNDQLVSSKLVIQLAELLIEVHGQHSHTGLANPTNNLDLLDYYGNLLELRHQVSEWFRNWQAARQSLSLALKEKANIEQEIEYLAHLVDELGKANIQIGEEEELLKSRLALQSQDKKIKLLSEIKSYISAQEIDQFFGKIQKIIARNNIIPSEILTPITENIEAAYNQLQEALNVVNSLIHQQKHNPKLLEELDERFFQIKDLANKYNKSSDQLPNLLEQSQNSLLELRQKINNHAHLTASATQAESNYYKKAELLTIQRTETASILEKKIQEELEFLAMQKTIFKIVINSIEHETSQAKGLEKVYFSASTNPGTPVLPLKDIASGGELSRLMLAIKVILAEKKVTGPTIIFDEIDTGIGGKTADIVGNHLKKLSINTQIILVTHQPQIASKATGHIVVIKHQYENSTTIKALNLSLDERIIEIARMISGKSITKDALNLASDLIKN